MQNDDYLNKKKKEKVSNPFGLLCTIVFWAIFLVFLFGAIFG